MDPQTEDSPQKHILKGGSKGQVRKSDSTAASLSPSLDFPDLPGYQILKKVGSGAYGDVYKAQCLTSGTVVAVKRIPDACRSEIFARQILREIKILRELGAMEGSENHVTQLLDLTVTADPNSLKMTVYMVMNYVSLNLD
mmetsp:Transcript_32406/g.49576  ORF Transcript_32406/g.49576 Transcript_32406/m.49576 type:complete len:140 (-) Transcript_32406:1022-1441(-)